MLDHEKLYSKVHSIKPDIIFLAAQALVGKSYISPIETWNTNVMGTANLLEVVKKLDTVKSFSYPLINVIKIKVGLGL